VRRPRGDLFFDRLSTKDVEHDSNYYIKSAAQTDSDVNRSSACGVESPLFASICASSLFPPSFFANVQASVGFCVHRLTAKLLLLFSAVGNIVPLVQAAIPAPPHACCVRKATHHCHESANLDSSYLVLRGTGCCGHECCRAVTTAQWAYPQPRGAKFSRQGPSARVAEHILDSPATDLFSSESSRAPPRFFIG
jgi:hypothetical protein